MPSEHDPVDRLLDELPPPPKTSPLSPDVWRRIAADARSRRQPESRRPAWWIAMESVFRQPAFAAVFVVACALLGLFFAEMRVSRMHTARDLQLARSYLKLIDPLLTDQSPVPAPMPARKSPPL